MWADKPHGEYLCTLSGNVKSKVAVNESIVRSLQILACTAEYKIGV